MQSKENSPKKLKKTLSQQQETKQKALKVNNLFNKLIAYNYKSKFSDNSEIQDDLNKFFEILLWCEKKCPEIVCQLFQMMAIQQIHQIHLDNCVTSFLKSYILLMGNCIQDGLIAQMFLQNKLPHLLIQAYISSEKKFEEKDQMVEYIGSFLKAYHRIFKPQWLSKFIISEDYFQLLQISFRFYNCPEPLTQTTVFNIVLDILAHKQVQQFIINNKSRYHFYEHMAQQMSKQIRNQLAEFGLRIQHISVKDSVNQIMSQIQDKITLWQDISRTCFKMSQIFQLPFSKNVLLPLLIGPLKYQNLPLFTLKYSLFIIKKLLKTIKNFGILQVFIRMIFIQDNVYYWPSTLYKAKIKPFNLQQILDKKIQIDQQEQKQDYGSGIRKFYEGVFRSKDNHFILMSTSLLNHLHENLKQQEQLCKKFGIQPRGKLNNQICQKLISQLSETHRLITVQSIVNTLVIMNNNRPLHTQLQAMFIHIFKKTIQQTKKALKQKSQLWDHIIQINQYDIVRVNNIKLGFVEDNKKFQELFKVVFMWDIKQEEASIFSFYSSIPDTVQDHFRYFFVKFLILRKARSLLIQGPQQPNMIGQYYSKFITNSPYNPGDVHKLFQIRQQMHECQIIEGKISIPALWIVDQNFFVLGHFNKDKKQIRIIMGIKYKHISAEMVAVKQKVMITLGVQYYDYKSERIKYKNSITIKGIETLLHKIISFQIKVRQRQMVFISNSIKKTEEMLPIPNLL